MCSNSIHITAGSNRRSKITIGKSQPAGASRRSIPAKHNIVTHNIRHQVCRRIQVRSRFFNGNCHRIAGIRFAKHIIPGGHIVIIIAFHRNKLREHGVIHLIRSGCLPNHHRVAIYTIGIDGVRGQLLEYLDLILAQSTAIAVNHNIIGGAAGQHNAGQIAQVALVRVYAKIIITGSQAVKRGGKSARFAFIHIDLGIIISAFAAETNLYVHVRRRRVAVDNVR